MEEGIRDTSKRNATIAAAVMHWATRASAIVVCLAIATTCERRDPPGVEAGTPHAPSANTSSASTAKRTNLTAVRELERSSSALALGRMGDETVAILADEDDAKLRVMKLPEARELASAKLDGVPGHVLVGDDGTIWIAVRDADLVQSFTLSCIENTSECALAEGLRIRTAKEPLALALADDRALFVVSSWGRELARHALPSGEKIEATPLAREARAVLVSKDKRRLVIAHAAGSIVTTVSLSPGLPTREHHLDFRDHHLDETASLVIGDEPRFAGQGFALTRASGRVIAPMVLVYPGDPVPSSGYGSLESPYFPNEPVLWGLADASEDEPPKLRVRHAVLPADKHRSSVERASSPKATPPCLLPRAAASDETRGSILVACAGIDQLLELDAADAPLATSELRRWHLPSGPSAIAIDPRTHDAWVWSDLDRKLSRIVLGSTGVEPDAGKAFVSIHDADASIAIARDTPLDPDWERGRRLFHSSLAPDGRACASCHPDARTDGLTWSSPKGPLQTPILAGRLPSTGPFGWFGESPAVEAHLKLTFARLGARSLDDADLRAIATYATRARTYLSARLRTAEENRGRQIFDSIEAGCAMCHQDGGLKGDGSQRDVGTGGTFDTPSLRFVGGTAPYMHDGRYATLREMFDRTEGKMGRTRHLGEKDMLALLAYLRSLE
ncbi:c-type cytochrome [Polyangium sp. 6x1]|uniref:c-type cytochrome n=1 Tax=Polyangium sp. 6x1 TaxID=3042689 RepID=UPI0024831995|nr:c-type cytochrome [Polyangium sp. 6x1]MDI1442550.1 c-type cytochrome [Polyangium sp. 6x1]